MEHPKLFISYCWTNDDYKNEIIDMAETLVRNGVDVVADFWDLKYGQDKYKFMESMVNDENIKKVAVMCNKEYAEKANMRYGGVGTESQIISKEIYDNLDQNKFVAVIFEKDEKNNPYLPIYFKPRIYIDINNENGNGLEQLLRWVFDKPIYEKPKLGNPPSYIINDEVNIKLGTTSLSILCNEAVKKGQKQYLGIFSDYCDVFLKDFEEYRISQDKINNDDVVKENIDSMKPYRDEFIVLFNNIIKYSTELEYIDVINNFLEKYTSYMYQEPPNYNYVNDMFDNFRFFGHEIFLCIVSLLIANGKYKLVDDVLSKLYYVSNIGMLDKIEVVDYEVFYNVTNSFDNRNSRLNLNRKSLRADLLRDRCTNNIIKYSDLQQADIVAYVRKIINKNEHIYGWYPITMLNSGYFYKSFEIFAKSTSKLYFDKIKIMLSVENVDELVETINEYMGREGFNKINLANVVNIKKLCTIK